eukprot:TRINITY_DN27959_c0_g1_i1.p1 TRINITY_DN27959_c0_g1~~TRINITY_DN27959_c0_g1_i1.p1  ORF type:complete len:251 (+),score=64.21 TRINITY_DN27959_c0_g1_i1:82-834(+)
MGCCFPRQKKEDERGDAVLVPDAPPESELHSQHSAAPAPGEDDDVRLRLPLTFEDPEDEEASTNPLYFEPARVEERRRKEELERAKEQREAWASRSRMKLSPDSQLLQKVASRSAPSSPASMTDNGNKTITTFDSISPRRTLRQARGSGELTLSTHRASGLAIHSDGRKEGPYAVSDLKAGKSLNASRARSRSAMTRLSKKQPHPAPQASPETPLRRQWGRDKRTVWEYTTPKRPESTSATDVGEITGNL